ncbi:MAG: helicase C-terminal domain-containing protein [Chloroflexota bacterium]
MSISRIYVALDLETTGLDPDHDAIIEIGVVKFREDEILDTWSTLVNPGRPIPVAIEQLTGISNIDVRPAPPLHSLTGQLGRFVGQLPLVGHNVGFDLGFLQRHGLLHHNLPIDTFELASILMPHAARYSLGRLAEALGIRFETRHRALDDAKATMVLFLKLLEQANKLDTQTIQAISRAAVQGQWPLQHVFQDLERGRARYAFAGSIGQQLMAKGALDGRGSVGLFFEGQEQTPPLEPNDRPEPLDVAALTALLAQDGLLARAFPGYEHRPQQVEVMEAIASAISESRHLLVEAGTGTGKSLAYLLPAIYFALQNGERVVISTNTINLQEQIYDKDIPTLQKILDLPFRATLLKGRSNYLCQRRFDIFGRNRQLNADEIRLLAKVLVWLPSTTTGDRSELFLPTYAEQSLWHHVSAEAETCSLDRCRYREDGRCFYYRARQKAEAAHLVIVNHALLLSDVAAQSRVLPPYRYLIVDEAHHLEAATTNQLSFTTDHRSLERLLNDVSQDLGGGNYAGYLELLLKTIRRPAPKEIYARVEKLVQELRQKIENATRHLYDFYNELALFLNHHTSGNQAYDQRLRLTEALRTQPEWANIETLGDNLCRSLYDLDRGLEKLAGGLAELEHYDIQDAEDLIQDLRGLLHGLHEQHEQLHAMLFDPAADTIYWAEMRAKNQDVSLHAAPLHVGKLVQEHLFFAKESVILTSATLRTDGHFRFLKERLGAEDADELAVGSPFDYQQQALLYLPTDIPEPNEPHYQKTVEQALIPLIRAVQGRTLVLFTSYHQLRATQQAIARPLANADISLFSQGSGTSRAQLLEDFRTTERSVLLGTRSFWEGIDVLGPALSCLVITRLPFSVPTDPIFAARAETFDDPFTDYSVPETILRFRQGFGRLIRSTTDRGLVLMLDKRVLTKRYGIKFLNSLPPCQVIRAPLSDLPRTAARWVDTASLETEPTFDRRG